MISKPKVRRRRPHFDIGDTIYRCRSLPASATTCWRSGDFELHLNAVCEVIPWLCAAGRNNYARYVPVYVAEMRQLETNQPIPYSFLKNGGFVIRRTSNKTFNCVASDQALEQTINRDSKRSGGIIGFTLRKSALQRWISTRHIIGDYASAFSSSNSF